MVFLAADAAKDFFPIPNTDIIEINVRTTAHTTR